MVYFVVVFLILFSLSLCGVGRSNCHFFPILTKKKTLFCSIRYSLWCLKNFPFFIFEISWTSIIAICLNVIFILLYVWCLSSRNFIYLLFFFFLLIFPICFFVCLFCFPPHNHRKLSRHLFTKTVIHIQH